MACNPQESHRFVKKIYQKIVTTFVTSKREASLKSSFLRLLSSHLPKKNPRLEQVSLESLMVNHDLGRQNDEENRTGAKPERLAVRSRERLRGGCFPQERSNNKGRAWSSFFESLKGWDLTGENILGWIRITTTLPVQHSKHSVIGNILPLKQGSWNIRLRGEQTISKCMVLFRDFSWKVRCLGC